MVVGMGLLMLSTAADLRRLAPDKGTVPLVIAARTMLGPDNEPI